MPPLLDIQGLSYARDHRDLARDLSFQLEAGDILRVEGPNGSGKTTLLRILAGLYTNYEGELRYRGESLRGRGRLAMRSESHFLGHQSALKLSLTPLENLNWLAALNGQSVGLDAVENALAKVGLKGYEDVPCRQLSAGQQRRVTLARLFLVSAGLWLLDEPFTALDRQAVAELEGWIGEFAASGGAVVLTTHHALGQLQGLRSLTLGGS
ncbi:heme exporter protein A [Litorivivens lipolytica]|uniref:Heme exporter protein A n=1 Tax=Litorivivens lipolytica TaxID=1524264 RepID=A0A7W4W2F2_9GAMM|nr:cytochrome c biogenesis heme-transporting ATPase CcmA [Litorivivens lipolytica]MBB3046210.1 heme exporter protein A [Litorivivens lipolytica]